jgi:glucose-1-phosphatase
MQIESINQDFLSGIENIIFDLGGVIVGLDEQLTKSAFKELIGINEISGTPYTDYFHQIERGEISEQRFRELLRGIAKEHGLGEPTDEQLDFAWNKMILKIPPCNLELLSKLKDKYNIYLLSNTNSIHLKFFTENAFFEDAEFTGFEKLFIETYYSHLIKARKPEVNAYKVVLDDHKLDPSKTLFIDDNAPNFAGAIELGIHCYELKEELTELGLDQKK